MDPKQSSYETYRIKAFQNGVQVVIVSEELYGHSIDCSYGYVLYPNEPGVAATINTPVNVDQFFDDLIENVRLVTRE